MKILNTFISNALLSQNGVLQAACHPTICDVINEAKLFPTVYTVANFCPYSIRRHLTKASASE